ncbi:alpha/beta fold hydrolase [Amnibacterium kyonggiense]|uniref:Alpha-beta hydrolase superfamily lysophospholipase n=1 Tax=Amnibacterium kyonggiense TaxID=595671 RepID=A0A4R7FKJ2_9MICO|nr:alpha/beta hydrolase [Amnibacterium kyonggiense]TDS76867.1 alpha-beta hydrolase superfamily lysophospholipase [Amnibacterium kyonggiense]
MRAPLVPLDPEDAALPDVDWTALPDGVARSSRVVPSGRLAGLCAGPRDAVRVVLAPGITGSKEDFRFLLPVLAARGFRAESFDAAGQYQSAAAGPEHLGRGRSWDYDLFVDDLIAVIEQGGTPVHLLGHSFQGVVAERVAVARPDLVRSLSLLSAPPVPGDALAATRPFGAASRSMPAGALAALIRSTIRGNVQHVPPARQRFVVERFTWTRTDAHAASVALLRRVPDLRAALRATGVPVLLAVGEHDVWPVELHRRYAEELGAVLRVYPGGHSPCETAPHALCRDLLALFETAQRPA